ncbi:hypothetical protein FB451DRAFT_1249764 [Mycena latifolia]|nr:hypothetical protein FB451DRAFT_1249764 [Mycena latifolia]
MERYAATDRTLPRRSSPPRRRRARLAMHACEIKGASSAPFLSLPSLLTCCAESRLLTWPESAQSMRHGPPTRRVTVRPRAWPRRLSAPSGGGICAVCGRAGEEPRMHDSAGYAARASRAKAALPPDSHSGASYARSPSSPAVASPARPRPHVEPSPARLPIPLPTTALARESNTPSPPDIAMEWPNQ